jgi:hypothetical protein
MAVSFSDSVKQAVCHFKYVFWACPRCAHSNRTGHLGRAFRYESSLVPRCGLFASIPHAMRVSKIKCANQHLEKRNRRFQPNRIAKSKIELWKQTHHIDVELYFAPN